MSSPGAGKTTLLERTIRELGPALPVSVIEGDQATLLDAERIRAAGARAVWFQLGVIDEAAFARVTAAGVPMVMDTCPAIEWGRRAG